VIDAIFEDRIVICDEKSIQVPVIGAIFQQILCDMSINWTRSDEGPQELQCQEAKNP
jgi:hypothetical protein